MPSSVPIPYAPPPVIKLKEDVRAYRKATKMNQWVFAKVVGIEEFHVRSIELLQSVPDDVADAVRIYLAQAPRPRKMRAVGEKPRVQNIYLTRKLLTWAKLTNQPSESVEAVRALREAYERAKRDQGLASIPLIQLEVENALTLATRGAYHRARYGG